MKYAEIQAELSKLPKPMREEIKRLAHNISKEVYSDRVGFVEWDVELALVGQFEHGYACAMKDLKELLCNY